MPSSVEARRAAQVRAKEYRRSDAKLRALSDLLAYLSPHEAAEVAGEIARELLQDPAGAALLQ
jgi:hypothetical protein